MHTSAQIQLIIIAASLSDCTIEDKIVWGSQTMETTMHIKYAHVSQ